MIKINLLPERMLRRRGIWPLVVFVITCASLSTLICFFLFYPIGREVKLAKSQLTLSQKEVQQSRLILSKLRTLDGERANYRSRLEAIERLMVNQSLWPEILGIISKSLPQNIWLTRITNVTQGNENVLTIEGNGLHQTVEIAIFMRNLNSSSFFEDVGFLDVSRSEINGEEVTRFKIDCKLVSFTQVGEER